jgi:hypothetical protein
MYEHREADRVPVIDYPWSSTLERWRYEGLPEGVNYEDYFNLDRFAGMGDWDDTIDSSPRYPAAVDWGRSNGMKASLHSCGNISRFIPELIEIGIDMLHPVEVKSGLDPVALKEEYGDVIGFHGGLNAALYDKPAEFWDQMRRVIPKMKKNGGYIISSDHSVPETASFKDFAEFVRLARELGSYE